MPVGSVAGIVAGEGSGPAGDFSLCQASLSLENEA